MEVPAACTEHDRGVELDWLETFLAVVDHGGFTAAAERIHRSQSRVSAHIAGLERALGTPVLNRHQRPAILTPAGAVLVGHARAVLAELGAARAAIDVLRTSEAESVTVLSTGPLGTAVVPHLFPDLLARLPAVQLTVVETSTPAESVADPAAAFSLAVLPALDQPLPPGLRERLLWCETLQVVLPNGHELASGGPIRRTELKKHRLVVGAVAGAGLSGLAELGTAAPAAMNVGSPAAVVELVRRGVGVGLDTATALSGVDSSDVTLVDLDDDELVVDVVAYWFDALLTTCAGRALHESLIGLPLPSGARAPGRRHS